VVTDHNFSNNFCMHFCYTAAHKPFIHHFALNVYGRTMLIRINWDGEPSRYADNSNNWIFHANRLHWQYEVEKNSYKRLFKATYLFTYIQNYSPLNVYKDHRLYWVVAVTRHVSLTQNKNVGVGGAGIRAMTTNFKHWQGLWKFLVWFGNPFNCYYIEHIPLSKPFDYVWFGVFEAIALYSTSSDNR
jgi:hypothetical protein